MTKTRQNFIAKLEFSLACCGAFLIAAGSAQAAQSCPDNSTNPPKDCDSYVDVSDDGQGGCSYYWTTQTYVVALNSQPKLFWKLRDPSFAWDGSAGVTLLSPPINYPDEDLFGGTVVYGQDQVFRWKANQTGTEGHAEGSKTFKIDLIIVKGGKTCVRKTREPEYTIVLKR